MVAQEKVPRKGVKIIKRVLLALAVAFVLIQFIPIDRSNPPVSSELSAPEEVRAVLRRACYDCHSNETIWPWCSFVAPVSWLVAHDVHEGREELNFSTWNSSGKGSHDLHEISEELSEGEMPPWFYVAIHPKARLTRRDIDILRGWLGSTRDGRRSHDEDEEHEDHEDD